MGWLGQLLLDETDFLPDFLDLSNNFTFRRSCRLPVPRINFSSSLFPLLDTTWALSTVVSISWNSVDLMCAKLWESMKVARFYGERRGPYWYGKEVIGMSVIDFFFCSLSLAPSLSLSLSLSLSFSLDFLELVAGSASCLDVTGWLYCNSKKPSPSLDASPWPSAGRLSLKYLSTGDFLTASLIFWKVSFYSWVQIHSHSCVSGGVVALTFLKGFVGIWTGTALARIISALLILCWSLHLDCCIQFPVTCLQSILRHRRSNEWHFASFEFKLLLFQLDEFCPTMVLLFYY